MHLPEPSHEPRVDERREGGSGQPVTYASAGNGTITPMAAELFVQAG